MTKPFSIARRVATRSLVSSVTIRDLETKDVVDRMLRFTRISSSIRVTDLRNAGKRGKKVLSFAVYDLDYINKEWADHIVDKLVNARSFDVAFNLAGILIEDYKTQGFGGPSPKISVDQERGVDVPPPESKRIQVEGPHVWISVDHDSFLIKDKDDRHNEPTAIPPIRTGAKTAVKKFRAWLLDNRDKVEGMRFREILKALQGAGIRYHDYLAID